MITYINSIRKWLKKQWKYLKWKFKKDDDDRDHFIYD